ncbi:MAG: GNAT family N-acyltransferase [Pseudomonadota bacterium]
MLHEKLHLHAVQGTARQLEVSLARDEAELRTAQRLRYEVFVKELGATGPLVDHAARLERDALDPYCDHLLLKERDTGRVVGVYRLMRADQAAAAGGFYSDREYDLGPLLASGRKLLELGRSCLHPDVRGGAGLQVLWLGLAGYVARHQIDLLFGVGSFQGTDARALAQPLSLLHHRHLAPRRLRVKAREDAFQNMNLLAEEAIDRKAAMLQVPGLIRSYLRLGGYVGQGAFVDHAFNTTDVCLMLDTARLNPRQARLYGAPA